ncbi:MAG: chemotaxis protein CheA [Methylicorpusculum sp.]|uniref:chemotaxis protein CheA n=1 Tax=Methylicorpusculum sp. TaxID=2713644 RepID=UPI00271C4B3D|nr:chemotaxis protein CheA [Methylicorpusculum sp.]MDO8937845.1 chemotaxis protein CheA [Methylicorpusculum sp.]MDP2202568.1 chemotaxis protein CheA [Methylicorpusculum sp.]
MAIDLDDEILQDFLVEAGEILDLLGEQLVQLEQMPEDYDLLNAIFRGFHTVKGGAGFLAIDALVEICHKAEDVFNILRQGDRRVSAELMDVVLQVLDVVNNMFNQVRGGILPESADPELLANLQTFAVPASDDVDVSGEETMSEEPVDDSEAVEAQFEAMLDRAGESKVGGSSASSSDEITEEEFEALLDALQGKGNVSAAPKNQVKETVSQGSSVESDDMTEEEFDRLMDELHGKGKFKGAEIAQTSATVSKSVAPDEISDDEFEKVMDEIHGKGKFDASKLSIVEPQSKKESIPNNKAMAASAAVPQAASRPTVEAKPVVSVAAPSSSPSGSDNKAQKAGTPQVETSVRVDTQVLDEIMNMVGELVLVRNRLQTLKLASERDDQMAQAIANLAIVTSDLQLAVMKTRMQPIKKVFGRFPRVVRDLARSLKKEIRLELIGEETDLDKNLVEALADPLVHLVRNAVDHGIELPDEREKAGKPKEGIVVLTASQQGDHIQLSIRDDGKGMNADVLRAKVVEKGLMDPDTAARLDNRECFNLIFMPGFSTKTEISDVSGRGVGMDVVKTRISQMNGTVEVDSTEGYGSTITIKVPLTLAIMPTLMVRLFDQAFALPLASVIEILDLDLRNTNVVDGQLVIMVRNKALPLFYLGEWLIRNPHYEVQKRVAAHVVVVNAGGRQVGFVVDQLIGQEEVVIKALGAKLQGLDGLSGATITGDGRIALILDVPGLMKKYAS